MQLSSSIQSLLAVAVMAPSVLATPVTVSNPLEERGNIMKRSYTSTCDQCNVDWQGQLTCQCTKTNGQKVSSTLYLSGCVVNVNGIVMWRRGGGFNGSCIVLEYAHPLMLASCRGPGGTLVESVLNLDEKIHNINGKLECHV